LESALTGSAQKAGLSRSQYRSTGARSEAVMVYVALVVADQGESKAAINTPPLCDAAAMIREAAGFFQSRFTLLARPPR
jgi:hypothetical protein